MKPISGDFASGSGPIWDAYTFIGQMDAYTTIRQKIEALPEMLQREMFSNYWMNASHRNQN
jgi:hypothetical protein